MAFRPRQTTHLAVYAFPPLFLVGLNAAITYSRVLAHSRGRSEGCPFTHPTDSRVSAHSGLPTTKNNSHARTWDFSSFHTQNYSRFENPTSVGNPLFFVGDFDPVTIWVSDLDASILVPLGDILKNGHVITSQPIAPFINLRGRINSEAIMEI